MKKKIILHISADYPDDIKSVGKTKAVFNLIENTDEFNHIVFSVNRQNNIFSFSHLKNRNIFSIKYGGLPFGIWLEFSMICLGKYIEELIKNLSLDFDIIHAHKLTYEGMAAEYLSHVFKKPFVCTLRGSTDLNVFKYKPLYRKKYTRIFENSMCIFTIAPWPIKILERKYHIFSEKKIKSLPNIVTDIKHNGHTDVGYSTRIVTAFRLDLYKIKNIERLILGFDQAAKILGDIHLDIIGHGRDESKKIILKIIQSCSSSSKIHLLKGMDNTQLCAKLKNYAAFVMPSFPETFGIVYLEALLAGIPIMCSKNSGIDGYFPQKGYAIKVSHNSIDEIKHAIITLFTNQLNLKDQIDEDYKTGYFNNFDKSQIINKYIKTINFCINNQ
jgi:glycosyltransferase involved in cell wall biosynthesis